MTQIRAPPVAPLVCGEKKVISLISDNYRIGSGPVFALLCGFLLLEERLAPLQWLGAALALVSVLLINRRGQLWQPAVAGAGGGAGGPAAPEAGEASGPDQETEAR